MRTYIIITNNLTKQEITNLKLIGVEQTSMDTLRKSNDGSKAILKWSNSRPEGISERLSILFEGTQNQILRYLEQNKSDWEGPSTLGE